MSTTSLNYADGPIITVAIPTFNRCEQLQNALNSVLQEKRVPIKVHVFDNDSSDRTEEVIKGLLKSEPRLHYTRQSTNIGGLRNCHFAIRAVDTEYFVPLADDDWLYPEFLYEAYQVMQENRSLGAVIFQTASFNGSDRIPVGVNPPMTRTAGFFAAKAHLIDWMELGPYQWSSILWRRKVIDVTGGPETAVGLPSDLDFQAQVFCNFPVGRVAKIGAGYLLHPTQASHGMLQGNWRLIQERLEATIRRTRVLPWDEYLAHRPAMLKQWRNLWMAILRDKTWSFTLLSALKLVRGKVHRTLVLLLLWEKVNESENFRSLRKVFAIRSRMRRVIPWAKGVGGSV